LTWKQSLLIGVRFVLAALALSALTFGLVGVNRYYEGVWNQSSPKGSQVFTISGQIEWFTITSIAVLTGAILLGALALVFPWALVKGAELKNLWDMTRAKSQRALTPQEGPKLQSTLPANSPLKCPRCGDTAIQRNRGIVPRERGKGFTLVGREFSLFSRQPTEAVWCEQCGYNYYRLLD